MKRIQKKENGITLIVLVITIIVLLILAGVSVAMLTSENGIINQAQNAKEETEIASEKEAIQLTMINREMSDDEKYNIGEELRDRTLSNGDNWKIVSVNDTGIVYGDNCYFVGKGTNLENYGETKYEWVIDYETGEVIELPEDEYIKLAYGENLSVTDGIILNADPINMGDSNSWGKGVTVYGIEEGDGYGWNETEFKLDGVDDYIEVYPQSNVNIENGLTLEFYAKSDSPHIPILAKTIKGDKQNYVNRFRTLLENNGFSCCMSALNSESNWTMGEGKEHWIRKDNINIENGGYLTVTFDIKQNSISVYWNGNFIDSTTCNYSWMVNGEIIDNLVPFTIGFMTGGGARSDMKSNTQK